MITFKIFKDYCPYVIVSISILLNCIAFIPYKTVFNGLALVYLLGYLYCNGIVKIKFFFSYLFFLLAIFLSIIYSGTYNLRYLYFVLVVLVCSPLFFSEKNFQFKIRFLYIFFHLIIFVTVINLGCYFLNVNAAPLLYKDQAANYFSGIVMQSMWLSALSGISTVVSFYYFLSNSRRNYKIVYLLIVFLSIFVTIVSASRIALIASLVVVFLLLLFYETKKNIVKYLSILGGFFLLSVPLYQSSLTGLQNKFKEERNVGVNSRQRLWHARIREFKSSPILGLGFSTRLVKGKPVTGRKESGSGWLSILSQAGLLGFACFLLIIRKACKNYVYINQNKELLLYYSVFAYLCIHSLAEGYILTPGYYLCFLFWILIDVLAQFDCFENIFYIANE